jgi:predicted nucleotidyltransferase
MTSEINIQNLPEDLRKEGLEEKLSEVCRKNDIIFTAIFGSFVKGEQSSESDIDIAIEFEKTVEKRF